VHVGSKVERLYRDIRSLRIYEDATEVQQLIIGNDIIKAATGGNAMNTSQFTDKERM